MSELRDAVHDQYAELDPDGGGFRTSEFRTRLFGRAESECGGDLPPLTAELAQFGCAVAMKVHRPNSMMMSRAYEAAANAAVSGQTDLADIAPDMGWIDTHTALDEGHAAVRKRVSQLTRPETLQVIALKQRKSEQAASMANRLQLVVDKHPEWQDRPATSLAEILGLTKR